MAYIVLYGEYRDYGKENGNYYNIFGAISWGLGVNVRP